jgi:hypothetical protein
VFFLARRLPQCGDRDSTFDLAQCALVLRGKRPIQALEKVSTAPRDIQLFLIDRTIAKYLLMSKLDPRLDIPFRRPRTGPVYHKSHHLRRLPFSKATNDHAKGGPISSLREFLHVFDGPDAELAMNTPRTTHRDPSSMQQASSSRKAVETERRLHPPLGLFTACGQEKVGLRWGSLLTSFLREHLDSCQTTESSTLAGLATCARDLTVSSVSQVGESCADVIPSWDMSMWY